MDWQMESVCKTRDSLMVFAVDFAVHRLNSFFCRAASTLAVTLVLLFYFFKYFFFFLANNDLSCLFKEFITPQKCYSNRKEVCKKPFGWEPLALICWASALCSYQTIIKLKKKDESKQFGVNKDKSMSVYPSSNIAVRAQERASRRRGRAACSCRPRWAGGRITRRKGANEAAKR